MNALGAFSAVLIAVAMGVVVFVMARRVEASTRTVELAARKLTSLLAGMQEGLLYFGPDGVVPQQRSEALSCMLPGHEAHNTLASLLEAYAGTPPTSVEFTLQTLFPSDDDDFYSPFEATISFLPQSLKVEERDLALRWLPHHDADGKLDRVYVSVRDVTDELASAREATYQAERVDRIGSAAKDIDAFKGYVREAEALVSTVAFAMIELEEAGGAGKTDGLMRAVHTFKGVVASFGHQTVASEVHELEDMVVGGGLSDDFEAVAARWRKVSSDWDAEVRDVEQVLRIDRNARTVTVDQRRLEALRDHPSIRADSALAALVDGLNRVPLGPAFARYAAYTKGLARRKRLAPPKVNVARDAADVTRAELEALDAPFVHLLRNIVDHGLEPAAEREEAGKPAGGTVRVDVRRSPSGIEVILDDDGRGVQTEKLAARAVESGVWTEAQAAASTEEERLELMFASGLSSQEEATQTSGRGVGMDLIREHLRARGGDIVVTTTPGKGTRFVLTLAPDARAPVRQVG